MASKRVEQKPDKKESVVDIIVYAFALNNAKPDKSHYSKWCSQINPFLTSEDDMRVYTIDQIKSFVKYLFDNGVTFQPEHLYIPSFLSYFVDGKLGSARVILERIIQKNKSVEAEDNFSRNLPGGW